MNFMNFNGHCLQNTPSRYLNHAKKPTDALRSAPAGAGTGPGGVGVVGDGSPRRQVVQQAAKIKSETARLVCLSLSGCFSLFTSPHIESFRSRPRAGARALATRIPHTHILTPLAARQASVRKLEAERCRQEARARFAAVKAGRGPSSSPRWGGSAPSARPGNTPSREGQETAGRGGGAEVMTFSPPRRRRPAGAASAGECGEGEAGGTGIIAGAAAADDIAESEELLAADTEGVEGGGLEGAAGGGAVEGGGTAGGRDPLTEETLQASVQGGSVGVALSPATPVSHLAAGAAAGGDREVQAARVEAQDVSPSPSLKALLNTPGNALGSSTDSPGCCLAPSSLVPSLPPSLPLSLSSSLALFLSPSLPLSHSPSPSLSPALASLAPRVLCLS